MGAVVPVTGRYAPQGAQVRLGLELWARFAGARLAIEDDASRPERAARLSAQLADECRFVVGPYGSDSARAVAAARPEGMVWNHGAAADDVQRLPGVVSVPSPASRYLVALGRAIAALRPHASFVLVTARGRFARFAREGLEAAAPSLGLRQEASFSFDEVPGEIAAPGSRRGSGFGGRAPDAILACGPVGREVALFRALAHLRPDILLGGVSPGLLDFPVLLDGDPDGFVAPVQWHPRPELSPPLGPSTAQVLAQARRTTRGGLDYVGAQAYAAALIAERCLELDPEDPLGAARRLRTTTFFGSFELDPQEGVQRGHRLAVVRWRAAQQDLLLPEAV